MDSHLLTALYPYYREPDKMNLLWLNDDVRFGELLMLVLDKEQSSQSVTMMDEYAEYFISYTAVFLIQNNSDLIKIYSMLQNKMPSFMKRYFANTLISNEMVLSILNDEQLMISIGDFEEWIEYPLMLRTTKLMEAAEAHTINAEEIIPLSMNITQHLQQYLLSWAYEEDKLSHAGECYFRDNFSKKYEQLRLIKTKQFY